MAAKKNKGAETEGKGEGSASPKKRNEILREDLLTKYLGEAGLPAEGTAIEMADRLEAFYEHEHRKAGEGPEAMLECLPPQRDNGTFDEEGNLGCFRSAPVTVPECPFCGMTDVLTTAPAAPKEHEKKGGKKGKGAKKDEPEARAKTNPEPAPEASPTADEKVEPAVAEPVAPKEEEIAPPASEKADAAPAVAGMVKTNAAKIRKGKGAKGAASLAAPALDVPPEDIVEEPSPAGAPPLSATVASPAEPEDSAPPSGATVADLDLQCRRVERAKDSAERTTALSLWEQGDAIREIHEKKLWALVRNDDGSPVYRSFGEFTARRFDMSQPTAYAHKKVAEVFDRGTAEALGFTRVKELLSAQELPETTFASLVARALKRADAGAAFVLSVRELRDEVAKEKRLLVAPAPSVAPISEPATAVKDRPEEERDEEAEDEPEERSSTRVDHDEDGVVRESEDRRSRASEPKTVTVSLADTRIVVPLFKKGSSVKPAKKIEDGCHGSFSGINGATVKVEIVIGEGAELQLVMAIERPR